MLFLFTFLLRQVMVYFLFMFFASYCILQSQTKMWMLYEAPLSSSHPIESWTLILYLHSCEVVNHIQSVKLSVLTHLYISILFLGWIIFSNIYTSSPCYKYFGWENLCKASCLLLIKVEVFSFLITNQNWNCVVTL